MPDAERLDPGAVVELVVRERHHQLRRARAQGFGRGPDAAVVHQHRHMRQQGAQRHILLPQHMARQGVGQLVAVRRQEDGALAEQVRRLGRVFEPGTRLAVAGAGREHQRPPALPEEVLQLV